MSFEDIKIGNNIISRIKVDSGNIIMATSTGLEDTRKRTNLPKRYIINKRATILFWDDDSKTIVKRTEGDSYNKVLGFLWAYFQKTSGLSKTKANKYLAELIDEEVASEDIKNVENTDSKVANKDIDFKIGDKVEIVTENSLHHFKIGTIGRIIGIEKYSKLNILVRDIVTNLQQYVSEDDIIKVE